jgi:hypothetical protein
MSRHTKLHDALPEAAREPIRKLIRFEAEKYARAVMRKGKRKFNWSMLWTLVALALLLVVAELSLVAAAVLWWPAYLVAGLFGGFGGALLGYGSRQLFEYEEGDPLTDDGEASVDADDVSDSDTEPTLTASGQRP